MGGAFKLRIHVTCHIGELVVVGQAFVDVALGQTEEFVGQFGFRALEQVETGFLEGEFFEFGFRSLVDNHSLRALRAWLRSAPRAMVAT